jgi:hypothetical protein
MYMKIILGIVGDRLDPALVSMTLGGQPRKSGRKGDPIQATDHARHPISRPAIAGYWQRGVSLPPSTTADSAIRDLFAGLKEDAGTWQKLGLQFRTEIAVHGVLPQVTPQDVFSKDTLALFRQRGLQVVLRER